MVPTIAIDASVRDRDAAPSYDDSIAAWREAYRAMGFKPSRTLSSVEALLRRARKQGANWMTGVRQVDLCNALSIRRLAPMGGYATAKLPSGPIGVRAAAPTADRHVPIGGKVDGFTTPEKVVVYAVGHDVMCRALNHRDAASFGSGTDTEQAVFPNEALDDAQAETSRAALRHLAEIAERHGARCSPVFRHTPQGSVRELAA